MDKDFQFLKIFEYRADCRICWIYAESHQGIKEWQFESCALAWLSPKLGKKFGPRWIIKVYEDGQLSFLAFFSNYWINIDRIDRQVSHRKIVMLITYIPQKYSNCFCSRYGWN